MKGSGKKINKSISSWDAVNNMIHTKGAILSKISFSSLTGFIFKLTIPPESNYEFTEMNGTAILSVVFKIVVISDRKEHLATITTDSKQVDKNT
jgi:hypothetical protein